MKRYELIDKCIMAMTKFYRTEYPEMTEDEIGKRIHRCIRLETVASHIARAMSNEIDNLRLTIACICIDMYNHNISNKPKTLEFESYFTDLGFDENTSYILVNEPAFKKNSKIERIITGAILITYIIYGNDDNNTFKYFQLVKVRNNIQFQITYDILNNYIYR